jgi:hypothetical protein
MYKADEYYQDDIIEDEFVESFLPYIISMGDTYSRINPMS